MPRFEKKFMVAMADYEAIRSQLKILARPDPYGSIRGSYPVFSKYYDTEDREFYWQKVNGEFLHLKVRKRCYNFKFDPSQTHYVEAKIKSREQQLKVRLNPGQQSQTPEQAKDWDLLNEIIANRKLYAQCNVYYEREAFHIETDQQLIRINFDHNITAIPSHCDQITQEYLEINRLDSGQFILMEVKSPLVDLPNLISQIIAYADTRPMTFSKYIWSCDLLTSRQESL